MSYESSHQRVLHYLREKGKAKNSDLLSLAENDPVLLSRIREDLIFEDLAADKNGVGLVYTGPEQTKIEETTRTPLRIFLSYGHDEHADFSKKLKADFAALGHEVWFDADRLKPGGDWESYIEEGLAWASEAGTNGRIVLVMTPHSVRRPDGYCLNEIARACSKQMEIIPVMLVEAEPPLSICRIQWLDMRECTPLAERMGRYESLLPRLIDAVETGRLDFEGAQSRVFSLLNPLSFEADFSEHLRRFTGREWLFEKFDAWLKDENGSRVFWLTGGPGIGKTAFISKLCTERKEVAAFHICRHNHDQKADPRALVRSIAWQLGSQLPAYFERLANLRDLDDLSRESNAETLFDRLVVQPLHGGFPAPGRIILVAIDGLDEAVRDGKNETALFLSHNIAKLPDWMRLVLTSRPVPEVMRPLQELTPLVIEADTRENMDDIKGFLRRELAPYAEGKKVPEASVARIAKLSEGYFLYAEWIRKELEMKTLSLSNLDEFPKGPGGAYDRFFRRSFQDKTDWRNRLRPTIELIAAAHEPLTPSHLGEILGWSVYDKKEIPDALASLFPAKSGALRPFHRTVIDWVTDPERAGDYFVGKEEGSKRLAKTGFDHWQQKGINAMTEYDKTHLPRHLLECKRYEDAAAVLTDLNFLEQAWEKNEYDIKAWWAALVEQKHPGPAEAYKPAIENAEPLTGAQCLLLARLFYDTGSWDESLKMWDAAIIKYETDNNYKDLAEALWRKAIIVRRQGNGEESLSILDQGKVLCIEHDLQDALQNTLRHQGHVLRDWGRLEEAMALYEQSMEICESIKNTDGVQWCLGSRAGILNTWGQLKEAMVLHQKREVLCRESGNLNGLQESLGSQAIILQTRGKLEAAMALHKEEERICRELGNLDGLQGSLGSQAGILQTWGKLEEAMALYKEKERICRELGNKRGLNGALLSQANLLYGWGKVEEAMEMYKAYERVSRELGDKDGLQVAYSNQAMILGVWGKLEEAMALYKEKERICRELGNLNGLQSALGSQAGILQTWGKLEEAMALHKEKERICRELGNLNGLQSALGSQAWILKTWGKLEEAMALYKEKERICRELDNPNGVRGALGSQATILYTWGRLEEAMALHKEEERICRKLGYLHGLHIALQSQAHILNNWGKLDEAMALYKERAAICRELGNLKELQAAIGEQAGILINMGSHDDAIPLLNETIEISRKEKLIGNLPIFLMNRSLCLEQKGEYVRAREDLEEAAQVAVKKNDKIQIAQCRGYQASLHHRLGDVDKGFELYAQQESLLRELKETYVLCQCLANQAMVLAEEKADFETALAKAEEALLLAEQGKFGDMLDPVRSLRDQIKQAMMFRFR